MRPGPPTGASLSDDLTTGYATTFSAAANAYASITSASIANDTVNEEHETFTVTINAGTGYLVGSPATVTVTIEDNDPPPAPSGLSLTAGSGKLSASWTKPVGPVTGYQLRHKEASATNQAATTPGDPSTGWVTGTEITTTSAEITGLTNGTAYHVQVRATDGQAQSGNGYGDWSASQSGTPAVWTTLTVTAGDSKLDLSWNAPASGTVLGYYVDYTSSTTVAADATTLSAGSLPASGWVQSRDGVTDGTSTTHSITSLSNGTAYRVRVQALFADLITLTDYVTGTGTPVAPAVQPPAAPTNLGVSPGDGSLSLSWTAPSGTVTGYDVHYTSAASGTVANDAAVQTGAASVGWVNTSHTGTTASQTISSLSNGTLYRVRVRAKNGGGSSAWVFGMGTPVAVNPPGVPRNVRILPGNNAVTLRWQAPASWGDWSASRFVIQEFFTDASGGAQFTRSPSATSRTIQRGARGSGHYASNGQTETWKIRAVSQKPGSDGTQNAHFLFSDWVSVTVTVGVPAVPTGLSAVAGDGKLDLSWTAPAQNGAAISGYDVHYTSAASGTVTNSAAASGNDPSAAWVNTSHSGTTASQAISALANDGTQYRWRVRAKNSIGAGGWAFGTGRTLIGVSLSADPNPVTEGADVTVTATLLGVGVGGDDPGDCLHGLAEHGGVG